MSIGIGFKIRRTLIMLGIRVLDLLILGGFLVWIILWNVEEQPDPFVAVADSIWMILGVFLVWIITVAFVEAICVYFRQDTTTARLLRVFVTTLLIITIFPIALAVMLWAMGYTLTASIQTALYYVAIGRAILRAFLGKLAERRFALT